MSMNRREFLQVMAVAAAGGMTLHSDFARAEKGGSTSVAAFLAIADALQVDIRMIVGK